MFNFKSNSIKTMFIFFILLLIICQSCTIYIIKKVKNDEKSIVYQIKNKKAKIIASGSIPKNTLPGFEKEPKGDPFIKLKITDKVKEDEYNFKEAVIKLSFDEKEIKKLYIEYKKKVNGKENKMTDIINVKDKYKIDSKNENNLVKITYIFNKTTKSEFNTNKDLTFHFLKNSKFSATFLKK